MDTIESKVYAVIDRKATSNTVIQALTGVVGFPFTVIADTGIIFTHYGAMFNEIRQLYGLKPIEMDAIGSFVSGCRDEVLMDIIVDKFFGHIPLVGIAANAIAARAMTWRLGLVMGMLSARGEDICRSNVKNAAVLVRQAFPHQKSLLFQKPSREVAVKLLSVVEGLSETRFDDLVMQVLNQIKV